MAKRVHAVTILAPVFHGGIPDDRPAPAAPKGGSATASFAARSPSGSPPAPARTPPARSPETLAAFADLITVAGDGNITVGDLLGE